jgi:hypothetical protein
MAGTSPSGRAYCTQQTGGPTRGMTLRAIQAARPISCGLWPLNRPVRCLTRLTPRHCVQDATVHFHALGPSTPNGSENDIRCQVTKRQVSGGTHSDIGRDCRDAFLGLAKTCRKLSIAFWDFLGARLGVLGGPAVPYLPDLIRCRGQPA